MLGDIRLRYIDQNDAKTVLHWENDLEDWNDNRGEIQYSILDITILIEELQDIKKFGQARWIIELDNHVVGCVDLTEINFEQGSASVGVLIADQENRRKGIATRALQFLEEEAKKLNIFKLISHIRIENQKSINLFEKFGYHPRDEIEEHILENGKQIEVRKFEKWLNE